MRAYLIGLPLVAGMAFGSCVTISGSSETTKPRVLAASVMADRVRGGWVGQMVGVSYAAAIEFKAMGTIYDGPLPWSPEMVRGALRQDDLYVEVSLAEVMDRIGVDASASAFGERLRQAQYPLWHGNAAARRALIRGVPVPATGALANNVHASDIDFQIESDFIGLMTPGMPDRASRMAERVGSVMASGEGLLGGVFVSALYANALVETNPRRVVALALDSIDDRSDYALAVRDVLDWHGYYPNDWRTTWKRLEEKWAKVDWCPDGAGTVFNVSAVLNGAYVVMALLYGDGDFARTMEIAARAGQDADCNASTAAGVVGAMIGYNAIPERFRSGVPSVAQERFTNSNHTLESIVASSLRHGRDAVIAAGGRVTDSEWSIPAPTVIATRSVAQTLGIAKERLEVTSPRWGWRGAWRSTTANNAAAPYDHPVRVSTTPRAEATLTFEGTGIVVGGTSGLDGGRANVFVDGVRVGVLDSRAPDLVYLPDLWHISGLTPGKHRLRLVSLDQGRRLEIAVAIVYATKPPEFGPSDDEVILNFHQVPTRPPLGRVFRSAAPLRRAIIEWWRPEETARRRSETRMVMERLRSMGIETIVNLEDPNEKQPFDFARYSFDEERAATTATGVDFISHPIINERLGTMSDSEIEAYLTAVEVSVIKTSRRGGVLIHCAAGQDRTGLVSAWLAIRHGGIDVETAIADMRRYGHSVGKYSSNGGKSSWHEDFLRRWVRDHPVATN